MKTLLLFCCLATTTLAVGEKQLKLDDIERDNLANERKVKHDKQIPKYAPKPTQPQNVISSAPLEYGFKPMKSAQSYIEPQPQIQVPAYQYIYPQYTPQYTPQLTYTPQIPQVPQYQYQQYENVPYIINNQLPQNVRSEAQPHYGQQYVFVQPYAAPSNSIQMIVDPKGQVKYFMYVPSQYFSAVKNTDDPLQTIQVQAASPNYNNVGPQIFTREPDYHQPPNSESLYITQPQLPPQPATQKYVPPPQQLFLQNQYSQPTQQDSLSNNVYIPKSGPKSLLDSYVPSVLQLQYYKQQQEAQNGAIKQTPKTVVARTTLTKQSVRIPNAAIDTTQQLPLRYRAQTFRSE